MRRADGTARNPVRAARLVLLLVAATGVLWVRLLPLSLDWLPAHYRAQLTFRGDDGREHVYLGDYDSYVWVRHARNYLRTGTTCDAVVDGRCRDTLAMAPVGAEMHYARSLHIAAIVAVHRVIEWFVPGYPLTASASWVPVIVGALGAVPAFAIGARLAGPIGGLAAALAIGLNGVFIVRSAGSDNDVWNVVLPLGTAWAAMAALAAPSRARGVALAAVAGGVIGLHAATWSGWIFMHLVVLAGLGIAAAVEVRARRGARGVLVLSTYWAVAVAATAVAGAGAEALVRPLALVAAAVSRADPPAPLSESPFPDVFATVGELSRPDLKTIAGAMLGPAGLFAAWLGLLLVLLPERRWRVADVIVALGGLLLYGGAAAMPASPRSLVVGMLAVPVAAAIVVRLARRDPAARPQAGAYLLAVWLLAGLYQTFGANRLVLLLLPPWGLLFGVAVGRAYDALVAGMRPFVGRYVWAPHLVLLALTASVLAPVVRTGVAAARAYRPAMNDAWWDTLAGLRDRTPADAIVTTWWDQGYWVKYVAERRTSVDGGTLATHVPHWIGRALLAPTDDEAAGLLRMLACGSDATPLPEGRLGAWGRLVAHGMEPATAHETVVALARLERDAARVELLARGLGPEAADDVLAATHCRPPPTYLVLGSTMVAVNAWRWLGSWEPRHPRTEDDRDVRAAAARLAYVTQRWTPCTPDADGAWICRLVAPASAPTPRVTAVTYRPDSPGATRLTTPSGDIAAAAVLVAGADGVEEAAVARTGEDALGVLVDLPGRRVLVGPPAVLRATFTRLMFLGAQHAPRFEPVDDRTNSGGERVRVWKVW